MCERLNDVGRKDENVDFVCVEPHFYPFGKWSLVFDLMKMVSAVLEQLSTWRYA